MQVIDRDTLTNKAEILYQHTESGKIIPWSAVRVCEINNIKTVDAEVVRHGRWIVAKVDPSETKFQCSECGREVECGNDYFMKPTKHVSASYPYCHCGAKMDLEV